MSVLEGSDRLLAEPGPVAAVASRLGSLTKLAVSIQARVLAALVMAQVVVEAESVEAVEALAQMVVCLSKVRSRTPL